MISDGYSIKTIDSPEFEQYSNLLALTVTGASLQTPSFWPKASYNPELRLKGSDWPLFGYSMAGVERQFNIRDLLKRVETDGVIGDFVEAGVWRGGTSIFARGMMDFANINRTSWLFDSFEGLPKASTSKDSNVWSKMEYVAVGLDEVKSNFRLMNVSLDHVKFVKGFRKDTFPKVRNGSLGLGKIAILRLDSDMWESTMDILYNCWELISFGGWVINDDGEDPASDALIEFANTHQLTFDYQFRP